ncbi:hydroquinone glucosyltransferase-like [Telopea speciosissima]|uniref:hydroquinone glucosyltransferase-like n=1 Tax=Telopea speciosissima TaxID=54955 RepID=UPI001CC71A67|nr:hydroquinone glucosyltransferase-like [Telopea speciosissima]
MEAITHDEQAAHPHVILLPSPGIGHIIPLAELAKRLILHNFTVTFTIPNDGNPAKAQQDVLDALPKSINYIYLTPVDFSDLPKDAKLETLINQTTSRSLTSLRETLKFISATHTIVAMVVDSFSTDAFDVANELNIPPYLFFSADALLLSLTLHVPKMDEMYSGEYRDMPDPLKLPGCIPILPTDLTSPLQDRSNDAYKSCLYHYKRYRMAKGILLNSFDGVEGRAIKALNDGSDPTIPPVYPIGPLIRKGLKAGADDDDVECLRWLDHQPTGSVLFVSFGSGGTLSMEQLTELAFGLELSENKFLWVIKSPVQNKSNACYFNARSIQDPFAFLPEGFLERTKGRGLVVPSWAPQVRVLSHGSTGGFITHCGWNSILESVVHGVPFIAWPLFAEQRMNSQMLVEDLKVALKPKAEENGVVGRAEIAVTVKCLMEGDEGNRIRKQMRDLQATAEKVLCEDGYTPKSLLKVAQKWKTHVAI